MKNGRKKRQKLVPVKKEFTAKLKSRKKETGG